MTNSTKNKQPIFIAYGVKEGKKKGDKGIWNRVGAVWPHEDGEGYTLQLDYIPTFTNRIMLRGKPVARNRSTISTG